MNDMNTYFGPISPMPWQLSKCECDKYRKNYVCQNYNIVDKKGDCVLSGGWSKASKEILEFMLDAVNGLNPEPLGSHPLPWTTERCFSEMENLEKECWCFTIIDADGTEVIHYGEIGKADAQLIVDMVNNTNTQELGDK